MGQGRSVRHGRRNYLCAARPPPKLFLLQRLTEHHLALLLLPVPRSTMMCLLRKKNMIDIGSYSSYIALKSGTAVMSTR